MSKNSKICIITNHSKQCFAPLGCPHESTVLYTDRYAQLSISRFALHSHQHLWLQLEAMPSLVHSIYILIFIWSIAETELPSLVQTFSFKIHYTTVIHISDSIGLAVVSVFLSLSLSFSLSFSLSLSLFLSRCSTTPKMNSLCQLVQKLYSGCANTRSPPKSLKIRIFQYLHFFSLTLNIYNLYKSNHFKAVCMFNKSHMLNCVY